MKPVQRFMVFILTMLLIVSCQSAALFAQGVKGYLVIIGNGSGNERIMQRYVSLAGGPDRAHIIILPMASSIPDTAAMEIMDMLQPIGVKRVEYLLFTREDALRKSFADTLNTATGIFFSGGDQSRLADVVVGTAVHEKLMELHRNGVVIGGGSAGAAIMSKVMITGNELLNKDSTDAFVSILKGNIHTSEGLGFLEDAIIDQHFVKRKRYARLISKVLELPELVGIGIDEQTAIIVSPDHTFEVLGSSCVVVYDARSATTVRSGHDATLGAANLTMHVLLDGDRYNIGTGEATLAKSAK